MVSNMHNTRLLRFLIILTVVVLTIFIYTSYSSTQTLAPPPMRSAYMVSYSQLNNRNITYELDSSAANNYNSNKISSNTNTIDAAHKSFIYHANLPHSSLGGGGSHGNEMVLIKKLIHHREPTIDVNAIDDDGGAGATIALETGVEGLGLDGRPLDNVGGDDIADETALEHFNNNNNDLMQEEQYVQAVDNNLRTINNSVTSTANGGLSLSDSSQHLKQQHQLQQTPDQLQQQQDQQNSADLNSNNINNNNLNKIPESDVLIPTSNLQKFIESADKILKNITVQQPSSMTPADGVNKLPDKNEMSQLSLANVPNDTNNLVNNDENDEALPPSVIMTIKGSGPSALVKVEKNNNVKLTSSSAALPNVPKVTSTTKKVPKIAADPTQGIPTKQIYECGHMNEEIDIDQICPNKGEKLKLLIIITSAQTHTEARLAIRQTWGHFGTRRDVSTAFILGRTTNTTLDAALTQENMIYGDLIRGHFIDSYNNLTLKTLSSLEWVDKNCPKAKYILKTDDDMFINVPKLLQFLDAHSKDKRVIYGRLAKKWKPIRNKKSKYYISTGQFGAAVFPAFTTGPAYVMTSDIVHDLYERSLNEVYLKLEDVYTTGIVAQKLGINRVHANEFLNRRIAFNPCNIRKAISVHMIKPNEQFDLWKKLLDQTTKCK